MDGFLNPEEIINKLELKENMVAADFGCGSGGWAIPLARRLKEGMVFAIDILEEPLSALQAKARLEKVPNIRTVKANVEDRQGLRMLNDNSVDLVLITNLLFQVEAKKKVMAEARRILKPGGKILVVDWKKGVSLGPADKVSAEDIKLMAVELGFKTEKEFAAGAYHWALVLLK